MYNIEVENIKKRNMQVRYFQCPNCNDTIDDLEYSLNEGEVIKCKSCNAEILIGNICKEIFQDYLKLQR